MQSHHRSTWRASQLLICALMFALGVSGSIGVVQAASLCSGDTGPNPCTGKYADGAGCTATNDSDPNPLLVGGAKIERRSSNVCDTKWTRVTNVSGRSQYTAASTRYGCTNYCSAQSIESGGYSPYQAIPSGAVVYTTMKAYRATPTLSCGGVSDSKITLPIGGTAPARSSLCTGQW